MFIQDDMKEKINWKKELLFCAIFVFFLLNLWMMFQPLMSAYANGAFVSGRIYVYGIGFLNDFGAQGVLTVAFPFLLMLLVILDVDSPNKECILGFLYLANALAYVRSLTYAKQWLCAEVSWDIKYHAGMIAYPVAMLALAVLVLCWIKR